MSFFICFQIDRRLPKAQAKQLASHLSEDSGLLLWADLGWFSKGTDCFLTTDSGDIFGENVEKLEPQPGVGSQLKAVVTALLGSSSTVIFQAAWGGQERDSECAIEVNEARFAELLDDGKLEERTPYRIFRFSSNLK